jgi:hypothetical protein
MKSVRWDTAESDVTNQVSRCCKVPLPSRAVGTRVILAPDKSWDAIAAKTFLRRTWLSALTRTFTGSSPSLEAWMR